MKTESWSEMSCERVRNERESYVTEICFLVSMETAGYYPQTSFVMKLFDFNKGGKD